MDRSVIRVVSMAGACALVLAACSSGGGDDEASAGTGFPEGTLTGAQGTLPGAYPSEDFQARMLEVNPDLKDYSYGPESYDATMLVALAALRAGSSDPTLIQPQMAAVSGAGGGTECTGWEECSALIIAGTDIDYESVSGVGAFNAQNDPSSAFIGVYKFGEENTYTFERSEEGEVPGSEPAEVVAAGDPAAASDPLKIGTLLPVTGSLSQLGPPEIAGVDLAIKEINDAGGIFGADVEVVHTDSSDANNASVSTASAQELIGAGVSAVIGAASSSVTKNVIDDITGANIIQVSPANTATDLSGYSPFYFRTAPPDTVQGDVLGNLIISDGAVNVGILVFNDSYGTSLRNVVQGVVESSGGTIAYGTSGQEFDPAEQNFATIVSDVIATEPDAIAILAFTDQTPLIVRELVAQEWDMSKVYFVDGNLQNFGVS